MVCNSWGKKWISVIKERSDVSCTSGGCVHFVRRKTRKSLAEITIEAAHLGVAFWPSLSKKLTLYTSWLWLSVDSTITALSDVMFRQPPFPQVHAR